VIVAVPKNKLFHQLPVDRSLRWDSFTFYTRLLGYALYIEFQERKVQVGDDWKRAVCSRICVPGRDRPPVLKALEDIHKEGLILVEAGTFQLVFTETMDAQVKAQALAKRKAEEAAELERRQRFAAAADRISARGHIDTTTPAHPQHNDGTTPVHPLHNAGTSTPQSDLSAGNDSGPSGEIDREKDREKERREPPPGRPAALDLEDYPDQEFDPRLGRAPVDLERPTAELVWDAYERHYRAAHNGSSPTDTKANKRHVKDVARWVDDELKGGKAAPFVERLMKSYFACDDKGTVQAGWPLAFLATNPANYLRPKARKSGGFQRASPKESFAKSGTTGDEVWGKEDSP
jgi:hypothetical protein